MNDLFYNQALEAISIHPKLSLVEKADTIILLGELDLIEQEVGIIDTYEIEIHPSPLFPYRFPYLYETGGRIPINIDWHRFEQTGHCCVKVTAEEIIICHRGISLKDYIQFQAIPYFFNQTFRRVNGYFLNERRHGVLGVVDFYFEELKTKDIYKMLRMLEFIRLCQEPYRVAKCFCGSGLKYRHCHRDSFRLLVQAGREQIQNDITDIKQALY